MKRKQTKPNKRQSNKCTKSTKISSLFPKRGIRNAKRTGRCNNKIAQGKTKSKSPRRIYHRAESKTNTGKLLTIIAYTPILRPNDWNWHLYDFKVVKRSRNCQNFVSRGLNALISGLYTSIKLCNFKCLLLWNCLCNLRNISHVASTIP